MEKLLLRPAEAAEAIGVSRATLYAMLQRGELPRVRVGRTHRVPVDGLHQWIADRSTGGQNEDGAPTEEH
jgi:excisionase family DNA binding protein